MKRRNVFRVGIAYLVVAWLVMQVADVILNNIEAPGWIFEVILLVLGISFPVILLFAWAFEMTPEGIKREHEVDRTQSITPQTGKKLDRVIIVILALMLAWFAWDKFSPVTENATERTATNAVETAPEEIQKSIAVLPLANRSNREEDQFFTDGIHDDLLTQLAKIADLKVISRTSVMRYRDTELPIPDIARQLGVTTILEGGIQRAGNQVRINVQLIEAETDKHLWAETYDRELTMDNLFAIQSEITRNITDALKATLTPDEVARIESRPTENLEAFQELKRGHQLLAQRSVESMEEGKAHFERALELDPQYAAAMAGIADAHHLLYEYASVPEEESIIPAMGWLARALAIDPYLGEAYMVRGEIYRHEGNFEASEADFLKAIELSPSNATAHHWFANLRQDQGFEDEANALLTRAHELNPMAPIIHVNLAIRKFEEGDNAATLAELARVQELHPDFYVAPLYEGFVHLSRGDALGALRSHLKAEELDPRNNRGGFQCIDYLNLGALEAAGQCAAAQDESAKDIVAFVHIARAMEKGDRETAMAVLDAPNAFSARNRWKGFSAMLLGRHDIAAPMYRERFPELFEVSENTIIDADNIFPAVDISVILRAEGDSDRADLLLAQTLDTMTQMNRTEGWNAYGFLDVEAYALSGDREAALTSLEACAETGYLTGWSTLAFNPNYDSIRGDPRFSAAINKLSAKAAEDREKAASEGLL